MKYLSLALVLLLAVGSHAAPWMADASRTLNNPRAGMSVYLTLAKDTLKQALPDFLNENLRNHLTEKIDSYFNKAAKVQQSLAPVTDSVVATMTEATGDMLAAIKADIDSLKSNTEQELYDLETVLKKHKTEYMEEILSQIQDRDLDLLRGKLNRTVDSLKSKFFDNAEETKAALEPILHAIHTKFVEQVVEAKMTLGPYIEENRAQVTESLKRIAGKAKHFDMQDMDHLKRKISPLATEIDANLQQIYRIVSETFNEE